MRVDTVSDTEIWHMVSKWFVQAERNNSDPQQTPAVGHEAEVELSRVKTWETPLGSFCRP